MEAASVTPDPQWNQRNRLLGHFDVVHVFAARGNRWEPIVKDVQLDLRVRVMPFQWPEQLTFFCPSNLKRLSWMSPFDFSDMMFNLNKFEISFDNRTLFQDNAPTLTLLLAGLLYRLHELCTGKKKPFEQIGKFLNGEDQHGFRQALNSVHRSAITNSRIKSAPSTMPGKWIGVPRFQTIPPAVIPYLELASILHIGDQTHFGCGSYVLLA